LAPREVARAPNRVWVAHPAAARSEPGWRRSRYLAAMSRRLHGLAQSEIRAMTRAADATGAINLGQGICDLPTPPPVADAAVQAIRDRKSTYTYAEGDADLRRKIAAKLARVNGIQADPDAEIVVTSGSAAAFTCVLHGLFDPGDELLVPEPYYGYHVAAAKIAGVVPAFVGLAAPDFELTEERLRASITERSRGIVLCTPSNPSGRMLTREEIATVARVAEEHDLLVITDEIYESITYDGREHVSPASTSPELAARTVTILGLSKTFSITGWRLGYAVAPAPLAEALRLVHDVFYICAPTPLQHGVAAGFDLDDAFFEDMRRDYAAKREMTIAALRDARLDPIVPEGAYYVLADVSGMGEATARDAAMRLVHEAGVASVPGSAFFSGTAGETGEGLVRFCFAKEMDVLAEACDRLRAWAGAPATR
ncbi:MAG: aminotransferase class I/II-fold pyridoxal phosphate-dependent enzyme, partial [Planctomycetota bacterium]